MIWQINLFVQFHLSIWLYNSTNRTIHFDYSKQCVCFFGDGIGTGFGLNFECTEHLNRFSRDVMNSRRLDCWNEDLQYGNLAMIQREWYRKSSFLFIVLTHTI